MPPEEPEEPTKQVKKVQITKEMSAVREAQWKVFDSFFKQHEGKFKSTMRGFFQGQKRRVMNALQKHQALFTNQLKSFHTKGMVDAVKVIFNLDDENAAMSKPVGRQIKGTYFDFAVRTAGSLGIDFNLNDPIALMWIKSKESKLVRELNAFTLESLTEDITEAVQEAVASGFEVGETMAQISDRIDAVYEFALEGRADRIARTEVVSASNAGNLEALTKSGAQNKEWLSSRDEKVRETHISLDGATVPMSSDFISPSGAQLAFPGDPGAPAEEVINCRCVVIGGKDE